MVSLLAGGNGTLLTIRSLADVLADEEFAAEAPPAAPEADILAGDEL